MAVIDDSYQLEHLPGYQTIDGSGKSVKGIKIISAIKLLSIISLVNTCLGEIGMGSGYKTQVTASEQGGVVKEPKIKIQI